MLKIKNYLKKYWTIIALLVIYIVLFAVLYRIFTTNDFIIGNDSLTQYKIFYEEWLKIIENLIKNHTFNTYSYNMFLGTDFYSAMGYYCTGDIFLPILYLFRNNLYVGLIIETILCILISGITMSIFLDCAGVKNKCVVIFVSFLYAVAGHTVNYVQVYMFHRFYAFLPLLFYGVHKYFNEKRKTVFILSIAILFMQNFYFMYPTLIVLFIYCLLECFKRNNTIKLIVKHFFVLLFSIAVGFLISSFITLPSILYTYKNVVSRTAFNSSRMWDIKTFFNLFFSYLMPNPAGALSNIFGTNNYYEDSQNMFMTIIPLIMLIYFLVKKDKKYKYEKILFYILTAIVVIKPLNSIMHGFSEPSLRWLFLYSFYSLYLVALGFDQYHSIDKKIIKNIGLIIVVFSILCFIVIYIIINSNAEYVGFKEHIIYMFIGIIITVCIYIVMLQNMKISIVLSILFVLFSNLFITLKISNLCNTTAVIDPEEINYKQDYDTKYYRYYLSYLDSYYGIPHDCNNSMLYDIMSTSTYSSTIETVIKPFLDLSNSRVFLDWGIEINDQNLLTMLGTKYFIIGDKYKMLRGEPRLEKAYSLDALKSFDVYFNSDYKGFGYTAEKIKYLKDYSGNAKEFVDYILIDDPSIDISNYKNCNQEPLNIIYMGENIILSDIELLEDNILLIPIPNNQGWQISVNNQSINPISVNGGFIGLELKKGYNEIKMTFHTPYLKEGILLSIFGALLLFLNFIMENKYNELRKRTNTY